MVQDRQREQYEREVQRLAPLCLVEARRQLSMGGSYNEADVWPAAMQLAAQHVKQRQPPRLPDPEPKLLAAPPPYPPEPVQTAGRIWTGRRGWRLPWLALGDGRMAAREETAAQVRALVAALALRGK
jgi:hypothetical protein